MQKYIFKKISFGSFLKLAMCFSVGCGMIFGVLFFLLTLVGGGVTLNGVLLNYGTSTLIGFLMIIFSPILFFVIFVIFATVMFPGVLLSMAIFRKVKIKAINESVDIAASQEK